MPRGGARPGAGPKKGSKQKRTIEREEIARLGLERARIIEEHRAAQAKEEITKAALAGEKLMKEIAFDFARLFAGMAAYYQPYPTSHVDPTTGKTVNDNPNFSEPKFKEYAMLAKDTAIAAAPFQSPRYSAMVVGASVVTKVEVTGGMPDDFKAPDVDALDIAPGKIIEAEDATDAVLLPMKPEKAA